MMNFPIQFQLELEILASFDLVAIVLGRFYIEFIRPLLFSCLFLKLNTQYTYIFFLVRLISGDGWINRFVKCALYTLLLQTIKIFVCVCAICVKIQNILIIICCVSRHHRWNAVLRLLVEIVSMKKRNIWSEWFQRCFFSSINCP